MSDLIKYVGERRKYEVDVSLAMSPGENIFSLHSITESTNELDIDIEDPTSNIVSFFVSGGTTLKEYNIIIKFTTDQSADLEVRLTLLVR